jgi:hypothetical protein
MKDFVEPFNTFIYTWKVEYFVIFSHVLLKQWYTIGSPSLVSQKKSAPRITLPSGSSLFRDSIQQKPLEM